MRLLLDGSFVTAKELPDDVDAVLRLPDNFARQIELGVPAALEAGRDVPDAAAGRDLSCGR